MTRATAARRLATAAAYGGGGLGLLGGSLCGVLKAEAQLARLRIGNATMTPPDPSGLYGRAPPGSAAPAGRAGRLRGGGLRRRDPG